MWKIRCLVEGSIYDSLHYEAFTHHKPLVQVEIEYSLTFLVCGLSCQEPLLSNRWGALIHTSPVRDDAGHCSHAGLTADWSSSFVLHVRGRELLEAS